MYSTIIVCASLLVLSSIAVDGQSGDRQSGVLNLMFMSSGGGLYNSSGAEPAVDLAVQLINENNIIPGYQLNVATRGNSEVRSSVDL